MKMFICGPVKMYPSTLSIVSKGYVYFRTKEFGDMVKKNLKKISTLLGNSLEDSLIYLASSGTGAMEATVENCVSDDDKVLVINGGGFGKRFCELLNYHGATYDEVLIKWNETLSEKHLLPFENKGYTTLFVNLHETTSGQLYNIELLSDFCKRNNMYLIVDAISTFLADDYDMTKYGIDVTIISSQKGLCCSPGMSLVSLSERMIAKINSQDKKVSSVYFDFKDYLKNITRGQTPYTPPVMIMYEIGDMLNLIENAGGKTAWLKNIEEKALYFRKKVKEIGLKIPEYPISNMLTPIEFPEKISAYEIIQVLKDKYQIYVNPCGGELAHKLLRVSHIGDTNLEDLDDLIDKLQLAIQEVEKKDLAYDRE